MLNLFAQLQVKNLSTMEIQDIKAGLNIITVLHHYGLKTDKHDMPRSPEVIIRKRSWAAVLPAS
jgi:hypothetical protein